MTQTQTVLTAQVTVKAPVEKVWQLWTTPADIMQWNNPSDGWHNLLAEVDLKNGGKFLFRMQSKDGSQGFDYCGVYDKVVTNELIELTTVDGRKATNKFVSKGIETIITETFEADANTPLDFKRTFAKTS